MRICIVLMACLYNKNEQGQVHEPHPDIVNKTWTTKFQLNYGQKMRLLLIDANTFVQ